MSCTQPRAGGGGGEHLAQVLSVEVLVHLAPDLAAADVSDVAGAGEVEPVGLVELGADEEVEVVDAVVLPHQRRRQPELAVRLDDADHLAACKRPCQS